MPKNITHGRFSNHQRSGDSHSCGVTDPLMPTAQQHRHLAKSRTCGSYRTVPSREMQPPWPNQNPRSPRKEKAKPIVLSPLLFSQRWILMCYTAAPRATTWPLYYYLSTHPYTVHNYTAPPNINILNQTQITKNNIHFKFSTSKLEKSGFLPFSFSFM